MRADRRVAGNDVKFWPGFPVSRRRSLARAAGSTRKGWRCRPFRWTDQFGRHDDAPRETHPRHRRSSRPRGPRRHRPLRRGEGNGAAATSPASAAGASSRRHPATPPSSSRSSLRRRLEGCRASRGSSHEQRASSPMTFALLGLGSRPLSRETASPTWLKRRRLSSGKDANGAPSNPIARSPGLAQLAVTRHRFLSSPTLARAALLLEARERRRASTPSATPSSMSAATTRPSPSRTACSHRPSVGAFAQGSPSPPATGGLTLAAIDAMELALEAGWRNPEQDPWRGFGAEQYALAVSGSLLCQPGVAEAGLSIYRPGYVHAEAGSHTWDVPHVAGTAARPSGFGLVMELLPLRRVRAILLTNVLCKAGRAPGSGEGGRPGRRARAVACCRTACRTQLYDRHP